MKHQNKRFTTLLAASMALGSFAPMAAAAPVFAQETTSQAEQTATTVTEADITYDIVKNASGNGYHAVVTKGDESASLGSLTIPDTVQASLDGQNTEVPVTEIGQSAFLNNETLKDVTLGKNITKIGPNAFSGSSIQTLTIQGTENSQNKSEIAIGNQAFASCAQLSKAELNGVQTIGTYAFMQDTKLTSVSFGTSLEVIEESAFQNAGLKSVNLPDTVTTIGESAFDGTQVSGTVQLPASLVNLGTKAFATTADALTLLLPLTETDTTLPVTQDQYLGMANKTGIKWNASVFADKKDQPADASYSIVGMNTAPAYLDTDADYFVSIPNVYLKPYTADNNNGPVYGNRDIEIAQGENVAITLDQAGTLEIDGKEVKPLDIDAENLPANYPYKYIYTMNTPAAGRHTVQFTVKDNPNVVRLNVQVDQKAGWMQENGKWYYLNDKGETVKNELITVNDRKYLLGQDGAMQTGWQKNDLTGNAWMFFDHSGAQKIGWLKDDGQWWFMNKDGIMQASTWITDANKDYYLQKSGAMAVSRWLKKDGHDVYVDNSGALKTGWLFDKNMDAWYYLNPNTGFMETSGVIDGWTIQPNGQAVQNKK